MFNPAVIDMCAHYSAKWRLVALTSLVAILVLPAVALPARGQEPAEPFDAFGAPPEDDAAMDEPPGGAAIDAFGPAEPMDAAGEEEVGAAEPAARPKPKPADAPEETEPPPPTDPAVLAILESNPQTPGDLLRAIDILVDLGNADLAKPFIEKLAGEQLDAAAKGALVDRFHAPMLLKLARDKVVGAQLAPLVDDWLKAAEEFRRDAQRLTEAADRLNDPSELKRADAAMILLAAREAAVAPLVNILADPQRAADHVAARQMLVYLGDYAVAPLLGVLETPDTALQVHAIEALGQLQAPEAVPQLLGPLASPASPTAVRAAAAEALRQITGSTPDVPAAVAMLERAAREPLERSRREDLDTAAPAQVWHWNKKLRQSMPVTYDTTGAALARATRLARELYLVDPQRADRLRLYLTAMLQAAKFRGGLDKPLAKGEGTAYSVAAYYGADLLEDVLTGAMAEGYIPAATAAAQILGDVGSPALLARGAEAAPLALAAQHADRRLRFAAIEAILQLAPTEPFAGSSHVTDGLAFFARPYGVPRVLVVHPRSDQAQSMAGLAMGLGYEADIATDARNGFELAAASPDYEFMLVHSALPRPGVDYFVAQLRRDKRTALIPIGIVAPLEDVERVERYAALVPRAVAMLQPQNPDEMKLLSDEVLAHGGRWRVSPVERQLQANQAMDRLVALSEHPSRVFDIRQLEPTVLWALYVPEFNERAAQVLGRMPTATAQRSLLELADSATQPLAARQAAADAFANSTREFGVLLTRDEILAQYDLYNTNAGRNADTNLVLGGVLDAIEGKHAPTGGQ